MSKKLKTDRDVVEFAALVFLLTAFAVGFILVPIISKADDDLGIQDDFGVKTEKLLQAQSVKFFGIQKPLQASAPATSGAYRAEAQSASEQVLLAKGLKAVYVTRNAANSTDMMVL